MKHHSEFQLDSRQTIRFYELTLHNFNLNSIQLILQILMKLFCSIFPDTHTYAKFNIQNVCMVALFIIVCRADGWNDLSKINKYYDKI